MVVNMNCLKQHAKVIFVTTEYHFALLVKNLKNLFLAGNILLASYECVRNLFQNTSEGL